MGSRDESGSRRWPPVAKPVAIQILGSNGEMEAVEIQPDLPTILYLLDEGVAGEA